MTQHVRKAYRKHRKGTWAALVGVTALAVLVVAVLPANANTGGAASGSGVFPELRDDLGGQTGDCAAVGSSGTEFRLTNPTNNAVIATTWGAGIKLTLSSSGGVQYLAFGPDPNSTGYYIVNDVIVKGGQKSIWYDYDGSGKIAATSDTRLHAPPKGNTYFPISHVTFCVTDADTIVTELACGGSDIDSGNRYTVQLGGGTGDGNCSKGNEMHPFILQSYTQPNGTTAYVFVPYGTAASGKILLVEKLVGSFTPSASDPSPQANIVYDDFVGVPVREMPYCDYDPRMAVGGTLLKDNPYYSAGAPTTEMVQQYADLVLPTGHTSCLLEAHQNVQAATSDLAPVIVTQIPKAVDVVYYVFSAVDGYRSIPG